MSEPYVRTVKGVLDPVIPSLEQCFQVAVGCNPADAEITMVPFTPVFTHVGMNSSPVTHGKSRTPPDDLQMVVGGQVLINAITDVDDNLDTAQLSKCPFMGISLVGIDNPGMAYLHPDSTGRISVQRHGIATVLCPNLTQAMRDDAKFGDGVFVGLFNCPNTDPGDQNIRKADIYWSNVHGHSENFKAPYIVIGDSKKVPAASVNKGGDMKEMPKIKIGSLVALPPPDRYDLRVMLID